MDLRHYSARNSITEFVGPVTGGVKEFRSKHLETDIPQIWGHTPSDDRSLMNVSDILSLGSHIDDIRSPAPLLMNQAPQPRQMILAYPLTGLQKLSIQHSSTLRGNLRTDIQFAASAYFWLRASTFRDTLEYNSAWAASHKCSAPKYQHMQPPRTQYCGTSETQGHF
ncbi:hypothetical protein N7530_012725 [Penicillium desertorum]|uniref:Uncharacterized protein n=1 Tax=Penicillium desertorum TaxID=1303715 RepID=A0A9X0BFI4_9EURO|nr:hypothetical protein N7530_012725 [Penicillium desertorum]